MWLVVLLNMTLLHVVDLAVATSGTGDGGVVLLGRWIGGAVLFVIVIVEVVGTGVIFTRVKVVMMMVVMGFRGVHVIQGVFSGNRTSIKKEKHNKN